jgi:predicted P-loop ATPase
MADKDDLSIMTVVKNRLSERYEFRRNVVLDSVEYRKKASLSKFKTVTDDFINTEWVMLMEDKVNMSTSGIINLLHSDFSTSFHPFRSYFARLPTCDKADYIQLLADTVKTDDNSRWSYYLKKWLIAMVACSIEDKITNHTVIVLAGGQGLGKTSWLNKIVPAELDDYKFIGSLIPGDKDSLAVLSECILINLDEFEALSYSAQSKMKSMITQEKARFRRPYQRTSKNEVRTASFCASVNNAEVLNDSTGSRRYLCFEVLEIDYRHTVDMDKVFAQAYAHYQEGFQFHMTPDDITELNEYNLKFKKTSDEEEYLNEFIRKPVPPEEGIRRSASDILLHISLSSGRDLSDLTTKIKFGKALTSMGFESGKSNGQKYYKVIIKDK